MTLLERIIAEAREGVTNPPYHFNGVPLEGLAYGGPSRSSRHGGCCS